MAAALDPRSTGPAVVDTAVVDLAWGPEDDAALREVIWEAILAEPRSLLDSEPEALTPDQAVDYLVELQQAQARMAALEARALVVAAGRYVDERVVTVSDGDRERQITLRDTARDELAAALRRSAGVVYDEIVTSRLLAGPLSGTREALAVGRITARHARAIADQARRLDGYRVAIHQRPEDDSPADAAQRSAFADACLELEARVLPVAESTHPARTSSAARAAVAAIDVEGAERRRREARAAIDVEVVPEDDGLALLLARLPMIDAARIHAAIDASARAEDDSGATLGERRAAALLEAVCGTSPSVAAEVQVTVSAESLLGLSDRPGSITIGSHGSQPLPAQAIRDLVTDPDTPTTLRRLVIDPQTGHLLDRGRSRYEVTGELRAFLVTRDRTCRFPGCQRAAARCQIDHALAWDDGGPTDRHNLGALCTRHHQLKTHGDWDITESRDDGSCRWKSPGGRTFDVDPPPF